MRKQVTQLASKMRFVAAQFNALLDDGLWIELATHANEMAALLHRRTAAIDGVELGAAPRVNSLFPRLPPAAIEPLREWCFFWDWDVSRRPGALDDGVGHHRRRRRGVRGGCGEDPCNVQLTTELLDRLVCGAGVFG